MLFPELIKYGVLPSCRDTLANSKLLLDGILQIIRERRAGKNCSSFDGEEDLCGLLLQNEMFASDEPMIADECFNFIAAATQASSTAMGNMIAYLHMSANKAAKAKLY